MGPEEERPGERQRQIDVNPSSPRMWLVHLEHTLNVNVTVLNV